VLKPISVVITLMFTLRFVSLIMNEHAAAAAAADDDDDEDVTRGRVALTLVDW